MSSWIINNGVLINDTAPGMIESAMVAPYPKGLWRITWDVPDLYHELLPDIPRIIGAFKNSAELSRIRIPKSVKSIGYESFAGTTLRHAKIAADCTYKPASFPADCVVIRYPDDRYVQLRDGAGRALLDGDARRLYVLKEENNG